MEGRLNLRLFCVQKYERIIMTKTFSTIADLQSYIQSACEDAVCETAKTAMEKLQECIETQYYDDPEFYPEFYCRTEEFLNSATWQLLSSTSAEVGVDTAYMRYKNGFDPKQVVEWASESMHGSWKYQTNTEDFWSVFLKWCDENLIKLLRQNLQKHGIKAK